MSETQTEDQTLLAVLEILETGADPSTAPPLPAEIAETAETLARLYTEVLGLIPYELAPAAPAADATERLLAAIGAPPAERARPAAATAAATPSAVTTALDTAPPAVSGVHPLRAARPLLAASVLVLLGLSGWLAWTAAGQRSTIAGLKRELGEERQKEAAATQQAAQFRSEFSAMRERFTLVTAPAALVGALRPAGRSPLQPDARGALFVAPDHQHWQLSVEGLKPAPPDRVYQLWFVSTQAGRVSGGTFIARPGERVELGSEAMPPDTRSAVITLEPAGGAIAPTGPEVLRAEQMQQVL